MYIKLTAESGRKMAIAAPSSYNLEEATLANGELGTRIKNYGDPVTVREKLDDVVALLNDADDKYMEKMRPKA